MRDDEELDSPECEFCKLTFSAFIEVRYIDTDESFYCCPKPACIRKALATIKDAATETYGASE